MNHSDNPIYNLSVDTVIFGYLNEKLHVLLIKRNINPFKGIFAVPGGLVLENEELDHAPKRILKSHTGISNQYLEQVHTFGKKDRFPERRIITVAYFTLVKTSDFSLEPGDEILEAKWFSIDNLPDLPFDHREIIDFCFLHLKNKIRSEPIGFNLLPNKFTLTEFQNLYEAILLIVLDKRNFRKKLLKMNLLLDSGEKQKNVAHRAAKLYSFDEEIYAKLKNKGFHFDM